MRLLLSEVVAIVKLVESAPEVRDVLRPARSFYEISQISSSFDRRVAEYRRTVEDIVTRRRELLKSVNSTPSVSDDAFDGKVLATDLSSTMYDGVAGELTGGYLDHADAPPPETWLAVRHESEGSPGYNGRIFLLSWTDHAYIDRVNVGIESTPSGCLSWVEDWRGVALGS